MPARPLKSLYLISTATFRAFPVLLSNACAYAECMGRWSVDRPASVRCVIYWTAADVFWISALHMERRWQVAFLRSIWSVVFWCSFIAFCSAIENEPMRLRRREAVEMDSTKPHRKTPSIHEAGMYRPTVGLMLDFLEGRAAIGKISEEFVIYMSRPSLNIYA